MKKNYPEVTNYPGPSNKNLYDGILMTMVLVSSKVMIFHYWRTCHDDIWILSWWFNDLEDDDVILIITDQITMVTLWSGWIGLFCISLCHPCTRQERGWRLFIINLEAINCCELFRNTFHCWHIAIHQPGRRGAGNCKCLTKWTPYDYLTRSDIVFDTITPHLTPFIIEVMQKIHGHGHDTFLVKFVSTITMREDEANKVELTSQRAPVFSETEGGRRKTCKSLSNGKPEADLMKMIININNTLVILITYHWHHCLHEIPESQKKTQMILPFLLYKHTQVTRPPI